MFAIPRRERVQRARLRLLGPSIIAVSVVAFLLPTPALVAQEAASLPTAPLAPTAVGAPFRPAPARASVLLERAELLAHADALADASRRLLTREAPDTTGQILLAQHASVTRSLDDLPVDALAVGTEEFGIDVGVFPVAELRKPFRNDWDEPRSGGRRHRGTDLLAQTGVALMAIEDGVYEQTTVGSLGGLSVYLVGDSGARYYYAHLDEAVAMEEGQRVYAGQVIGTVGDSGNATGSPHLHLQYAPSGGSAWENPYPLLAALYGQGTSADPWAYGPPNARP